MAAANGSYGSLPHSRPDSTGGGDKTEEDVVDDPLGAGSASYGDGLETLDRRRTEELKLIGRFDTSRINPRRECWFLVDTRWLERWAKFVRGEAPPPGRVSNQLLVQGASSLPREALRAKEDYRGVNPTVWYLYVEMYGKDSAPELCRYIVDIYEAEVPGKYKPDICEGPRRRARVEVQKMRWWVEPQMQRTEAPERVCCCVTEEAFDCFMMAVFSCCTRFPRWCRCGCPRRHDSLGRYKRITGSQGGGDDDGDSSNGDGGRGGQDRGSFGDSQHGAVEDYEDDFREVYTTEEGNGVSTGWHGAMVLQGATVGMGVRR